MANAFFGDRSRAARMLSSVQSKSELDGNGACCNERDLQNIGVYDYEIQQRLQGLQSFFLAWDYCSGVSNSGHGNSTQRLSDVSNYLNKSVAAFNNAWGSGSSAALFLPNIPKETESRESLLLRWLEQVQNSGITRGHLVVLDLILLQVFRGKEVNANINASREWLHNTFDHRIHSLMAYQDWSSISDLKTTPLDYCNGNPRAVCTPILLSLGDEGYVMWLTVDLFHDGLGSLAPDIFSLGWSQIAMKSSVTGNDSNKLAQEESMGVLQSFDSMWKLSKLGELGFSGRWRITNRPTTSCDATLLEAGNVKVRYVQSYQGRSAECAMLVCLLAASGFVYEPVPENLEELPSPLPERIPLSTVFAATGTVLQADGTSDIRQAIIGRVYDVDRKCGACARYKLQPSDEAEAPLIDTIVLSKVDLHEQTKLDGFISKSVNERNRLESQIGSSNHIPFRGIHFQPCQTVQDALNWMLSVNQWKRIWNQAKLEAWEKQWDVVRNEYGQPIGRELDSDGNHIVVSEEHGICTGSIEYMRNPFGGAKKPETVPGDEGDASDGDEVEG